MLRGREKAEGVNKIQGENIKLLIKNHVAGRVSRLQFKPFRHTLRSNDCGL